jgi:hypothetical protein
MKKLLWAAALALPLLALPAEAKAWYIGNTEVDAGAKIWFNVYQYGKPVAGPWYMYWPYEAHFMVPAPGVNPYFPPPMTLPPSFLGQPPAPPPPAPGYRAPLPTPYGGPPPQSRSPQDPIRPQGYWYYGR